jgi:hypothetical protein
MGWSFGSVGLVPGPALCPGAGAAEKPQEILYLKMNISNSLIFIP